MELYKFFVLSECSTMPDPTDDINRISGLHSWYKHLPYVKKAYVFLTKGEEARYSFDPKHSSETANDEFHWTVIMGDDSLDRYCLLESNTFGTVHEYEDDFGNDTTQTIKEIKIPAEVKEFIKRFPVYVGSSFGENNGSTCKFQKAVCKEACTEYWKALKTWNGISVTSLLHENTELKKEIELYKDTKAFIKECEMLSS